MERLEEWERAWRAFKREGKKSTLKFNPNDGGPGANSRSGMENQDPERWPGSEHGLFESVEYFSDYKYSDERPDDEFDSDEYFSDDEFGSDEYFSDDEFESDGYLSDYEYSDEYPDDEFDSDEYSSDDGYESDEKARSRAVNVVRHRKYEGLGKGSRAERAADH
ncbi:hypothetical protein IMZ48_06040 [Candidatus Bathyarchaeota archaeon]|nr:hypothetical protein [Candidatus Bathyarchaeota archaeon]